MRLPASTKAPRPLVAPSNWRVCPRGKGGGGVNLLTEGYGIEAQTAIGALCEREAILRESVHVITAGSPVPPALISA